MDSGKESVANAEFGMRIVECADMSAFQSACALLGVTKAVLKPPQSRR
jgi:hypothetical protein